MVLDRVQSGKAGKHCPVSKETLIRSTSSHVVISQPEASV
jgi:hypothetical protein